MRTRIPVRTPVLVAPIHWWAPPGDVTACGITLDDEWHSSYPSHSAHAKPNKEINCVECLNTAMYKEALIEIEIGFDGNSVLWLTTNRNRWYKHKQSKCW